MKRPIHPVEDLLWRYVREDLAEGSFEQRVYADDGLAAVLGDDDYVTLAAADYADNRTMARRDRQAVAQAVAERHFPRSCRCLSWRENERVYVGLEDPLRAGYDILAKRTPWIWLIRCTDCASDWLVGCDTIDDEYLLYRLPAPEIEAILTTDLWPETFADRQTLVPDSAWLKAFGYDSLEAWRAAEDPLRRDALTPLR
jgi:hypothetical protein